MPLTPFHFGPGAALHSMTPKNISFLAFCAVNVMVDIEPLYYMMTRQFPLHRFFHTYVGVSLVIIATVVLFRMALKLTRSLSSPDIFGWQQIGMLPLVVGTVLGGYSHILLDSIMHPDIRPLEPFSDGNALFSVISLEALHWFCVGSALFGLLVIGARKLFPAQKD